MQGPPGAMQIGLHGSIPLLAARLKVWSTKAAACGLTLCKWAHGQPTEALQVLVVGPTPAPQQLPQSLPVVHTSWLEASLSAGCPVPVGRHLVVRQTHSPAAGAAAAAQGGSAVGAAKLKRPRTPPPTPLQAPPPHIPSSPAATQPPTAPAAVAVAVAAGEEEEDQGDPDGPPGASSKRRAVVAANVLRQQSPEEPTAAVPRWFVPAAARSTASGGEVVPAGGVPPTGAAGPFSTPSLSNPPAPPPTPAAEPILPPPSTTAAAAHPGAPGDSSLAAGHQQQAAGAGEFVVVSYNVLADKYISSKAFCPRALRAWSHRWPRIAAELQQYDADIICLQEVDEPLWASHYLPWAQQRGYSAFHWARPYTDKGDTREGIALLVRRAVFEVVDTSAIAFKELAPQPPPTGQERFWQRVCGFQEGVLMAALRLRSNGQPLLACCTHLWFDPKHPDIKVAQADALCAAVVNYRDSNPWGVGWQRAQGGEQAGQQAHGGGQTVQQPPQNQDMAQQMEYHRHSTQQQERHHLPEHHLQVDHHPHQQQGLALPHGAPGVLVTPATQVPVIIAGDFNSLWRKYKSDTFDKVPPGRWVTSGVYELLSSGSLSPHHWHHPAARAMYSGWGQRALPVPAGGAGRAPAAAAAAAGGGAGGAVPMACGSTAGGSSRAPAAAAGSGASDIQQGVQAASGGAAAGSGTPGTPSAQQQAAARPLPAGKERLSQQQPSAGARSADTAACASAAGTTTSTTATAITMTSSSGSKRASWVPSQGFSTHGLQLSSAYWLAQGREPPLTNKHTGFAGCLDYIWVTPQQLQVTATLAMPYECMGLREVPQVPEAVPFPPIPNYAWPSDHLAVGARLHLLGM